MADKVVEVIKRATGASKAIHHSDIQSLWSGYGMIARYTLEGAAVKSVIVKDVRIPGGGNHPRGWNTDISHERKVKSYKVETAWYKDYSSKCSEKCCLPHCYSVETFGDEVIIVMEDLDASGFSGRRTSVNIEEIYACLKWLANFHATFMGQQPKDLWQVGTYWHLATRPDELQVLDDQNLKKHAEEIDARLSGAKYLSIVHGDAKLANFCFNKEEKTVAAVDFQYVGGGCGMKDVAYFIGSCLYEDDCEKYEKQLLDVYFEELKLALLELKPEIDAAAVEQEWRELYYTAWTDFHRFIKGWSPGHWKINSYSERVAKDVIKEIESK